MVFTKEYRAVYANKYYKKNRKKLRAQNVIYYQTITQEKREERKLKEATLHPLLISKSNKPRKGTVKPCAYCGKEFYSNPCRKNYQCCSKEHANKLRKWVPERICVICNNVYQCSEAEFKARNRKTCSIKCRGEWQQKLAEQRRLNNPRSVKSVDRCLRYSVKMDKWRISVFQRDNYTCQKCGARSGKGKGQVSLEAHHIKQFATHPELRFEVSNGTTLCKLCHKKVPHIRPAKEKMEPL